MGIVMKKQRSIIQIAYNMEILRQQTLGFTGEGLTSLQEDSLARTFQQLILSQQELQDIAVACGATTPVLFRKLVHNTVSSKIALSYLKKDLKKSYLTFPKSGIMQNGNVYQRPHLDFLTKGKGFLLLPTPMASDNRDRGTYLKTPAITRRVEIGKQIGLSMLFNGKPCPHCVSQIMGFPNGWLKTEE